MPESLASLIREVNELKRGSARLADQVEGLSGALTVMNDLQNQQRATQERVQVVADNAATKEELKTESAAVGKSARRRFRITLLISILTAAMVLAVLAVYESGRHDSYLTCSARSAQNSKVSVYLSGLQHQSLARARTEAERAQIRKQLAVLKDAFQPVDCSRFRGWF
jgi:hypothetical protein